MKIVEGSKIFITKGELYKVNRIIGSGNCWVRHNIKQLLEKEEEELEVFSTLICEISDALSRHVKLCRQFLDGVINIHEGMGKQLLKLLDSYSDESHLLQNKYSPETGFALAANNEMIDQVYEIFLLEKKLYKLKDYSCAKEDIRKNLTYFCSEEVIRKLEDEYNEKLAVSDIEGLGTVLDKAQQLIINHWKEYVTDIQNYDPTKPYNFLCHSTNTSDYKGDFHSRYVSCSLLSEQLTDTYRNGFGFILSPDNIVLAASRDMYVRNDAAEEEDLLFYSVIKQIESPERIKEDALSKKEESRRNKKLERVYTEVVVDGFHPIAIFYLDDGIKEWDYNYDSALELKEKFPQLEILPLDITQYKTKEESFEIRKNVLYKVQRMMGKSNEMISDSNEKVKNFDLFWKKYLRLIKTKNYTTKDIIELYDENTTLLFPGDRIFNHLFDGTYDEEQIEQILYYNYQTRIVDILESKASIGKLDSIFNTLKVYKDNPKLEELVPGISMFFKLYPYVHLDDSVNMALKKCNSIDSLNRYLSYLIYEKGQYNANFEVDTLREHYLQGNITFDSIYKLYLELKAVQDRNGLDGISFDVLLFLRVYPVTKIDSILLEKLKDVDTSDLSSINELLLESLSRKTESIEEKVERYNRKVLVLKEEKIRTENELLEYDKALQCCSYESLYSIAKKDIDDVSENIEQLQSGIMKSEQCIDSLQGELLENQSRIDQYQKHKFIHFFQIRNEKEMKSNAEISVSNLQSGLYIDKLHLGQFEEELQDMKKKFEEQTTFSFDEYGKKLEWAKDFISVFDKAHATNRVNNLTRIISRLESMLENYKNEVIEYKKLEGWYKK